MVSVYRSNYCMHITKSETNEGIVMNFSLVRIIDNGSRLKPVSLRKVLATYLFIFEMWIVNEIKCIIINLPG